MEEMNVYNIPAYQRKRSISAKARKKPEYKATATKIRAKAQATRKKRTAKKSSFNPENEISLRPILPSEEIFPNPMVEMEVEKIRSKKNEFREMKMCGICEGYFDKIDVAIIKLTSPLREGDTIIFEKQDGLFEQRVDSMQINRKPVSLARTGSDIGLKVLLKPNVGTPVYKVI